MLAYKYNMCVIVKCHSWRSFVIYKISFFLFFVCCCCYYISNKRDLSRLHNQTLADDTKKKIYLKTNKTVFFSLP